MSVAAARGPRGAQLWLPVVGAALALGLVYLSIFAVPPLITVFVDDLGLSHAEAGALMSVCLGCLLVTSVLSGRLVHRFGASSVIRAGLLACGLAGLVFPLTSSLAVFLLCRAVLGVAGGLVFAPGLAFVTSRLGRRANLGVGVYFCGLSMGTSVAFFGTKLLADGLSWRWPFWIFGAAGLGGAAIFGVLSGHRDARAAARPESTKLPARELLASPPFRFLLMGLFTAMFVAYGVLTWVPPYLDESAGFSTAQVSLTSASMTLISIPMTFTAGILAHRTGRPLAVASVAIALPALVCVFAVVSEPSLGLAIAVATLCITGTALSLGPMNAVAPALFGPAGGGTASGVAAAVGMAGAVASTYAGGWIVGATGGYATAFGVYAAGAALTSTVFLPLAMLRLRRRRLDAGEPAAAGNV